jgi:hypothetical protein
MTAAIRVMPWPDPVLDAVGHDPRSWYVETFWLPTLGPTALLLLRHLADRFEANPRGIQLQVADTAAALGLGPREGQSSPLVRSLTRLQQFELACSDGDATIAVRTTLPPVHRRHVRRLPTALQARHARLSECERGSVPPAGAVLRMVGGREPGRAQAAPGRARLCARLPLSQRD